MWETWVQPLGSNDPQEEGMTIHLLFLPGECPWTEEPGGLQSMGLQRVRHGWTTNHSKAHAWINLGCTQTISTYIPQTNSQIRNCFISILLQITTKSIKPFPLHPSKQKHILINQCLLVTRKYQWHWYSQYKLLGVDIATYASTGKFKEKTDILSSEVYLFVCFSLEDNLSL